jgi:hypothetical protein
VSSDIDAALEHKLPPDERSDFVLWLMAFACHQHESQADADAPRTLQTAGASPSTVDCDDLVHSFAQVPLKVRSGGPTPECAPKAAAALAEHQQTRCGICDCIEVSHADWKN